MEKSKKFQEIASGFQSLVFAIGLLCAGGWAFYIFLYNKIVSLELSLDVESNADEHGKLYAIIELNIHNSGNRPVHLEISKSKLRVTKISIGERGMIRNRPDIYDVSNFYPFLKDNEKIAFEKTIPPNAKRKSAMVTKSLEPGLYYFEFYSNYKDEPYYWYTSSLTKIGIEDKRQ